MRAFAATNSQGDVLGLYDSNGTQIVSYEYDSWGNLISMTDTSSIGIGTLNPIRYRGYYYDSETGFYYLQSRYYDPQTGRFLNSDAVTAGVGGSILGNNNYVYCFNNPVNMDDANGNWPKWLDDAADWCNDNIVKPTGKIIKAAFNSLELKGNLGFGIGIDLTAANVGFDVAMKAKYPEVTINNEISSENIGEIEMKVDFLIFEVGYYYSENLTGNPDGNEEYFFKLKDSITLLGAEVYCGYGAGVSLDFKIDKFIEELELISE